MIDEPFDPSVPAADVYAPPTSGPATTAAVGATATSVIDPVRGLGVLAHVDAEVSIVIGRTRRSIEDLLRVRPGSVLELDHRPGEPVEIVANGTTIARGDIVAVDGELGVRVTEIVTPGSEAA